MGRLTWLFTKPLTKTWALKTKTCCGGDSIPYINMLELEAKYTCVVEHKIFSSENITPCFGGLRVPTLGGNSHHFQIILGVLQCDSGGVSAETAQILHNSFSCHMWD